MVLRCVALPLGVTPEDIPTHLSTMLMLREWPSLGSGSTELRLPVGIPVQRLDPSGWKCLYYMHDGERWECPTASGACTWDCPDQEFQTPGRRSASLAVGQVGVGGELEQGPSLTKALGLYYSSGWILVWVRPDPSGWKRL